MSLRKNEEQSANNALASYMKELGAHDTLTRDEEIRSFKDLDQRVRDCATVLADAPARFFKNWFCEDGARRTEVRDPALDGDKDHELEPEDGPSQKFKSESVKVAQGAWVGRKPAQDLVSAVMVDGESREWAMLTINSILRDEESHEGCGVWIRKLRGAQRRYSLLREKIVSSNLRLVVHMMKQFHKEGRHMHRLDLIQEGNIGLMRAVERFEVDRGYRFSTYAMWWIRHHIQRGLAEKNRDVRLPVHIVEAMNKIGVFVQKRKAQGLPSDEETISRETGIHLDKVRRVLMARTTSVSMDALIGENDENSYSDIVEDMRVRPPTDDMEHSQLKRDLKKALSALKDPERVVITMRFNLGDRTDETVTLAEIGEKFKLSRERIRQLEAQALRKMNTNSRQLKAHWHNQ